MLDLNLYKKIYDDCQNLQSKWLEDLGSFRFSNRADFEPTIVQRSAMRKELLDLLETQFKANPHLSEDVRFGLQLHFEARILPSMVYVSKTLFIYYSPQVNTVFSFMKIMDAIFYDQMRKKEICLGNINEELLMKHIKAVNSLNAKPFDDSFLEVMLTHYIEVFAFPLKQAKLAESEQYKNLDQDEVALIDNPFKCIKTFITIPVDQEKGKEILQKVRESNFSFSKNSWDKVEKRPEIMEFIGNFSPEENSNMMVIVLPNYKPLVKSNVNNLLNKIGMIYRVATLSNRDAESNIMSDQPFNEAHHVQILFRMLRHFERLQFMIFDKYATKENNYPLGGIGCLYEIILSHFFRNYEDFLPHLTLNEVVLTSTFNPQIFTRTLFNNSCLVSPMLESIESIQTSMDYYTSMYQNFYHQNDIKDMAGTYIRLARIPDIILNRQNYADRKKS
jgi:hypothetical protein